MSGAVPDTTDLNVAALAVAWEIVRVTTVRENPGASNKPPVEIAQMVRDTYLTILGTAPKK